MGNEIVDNFGANNNVDVCTWLFSVKLSRFDNQNFFWQQLFYNFRNLDRSDLNYETNSIPAQVKVSITEKEIFRTT